MSLSTAKCWTGAEAVLATALANSATFQEWTSTADATEAATRIHGTQLTPPADGEVYSATELIALDRFAQIHHPDEDGYRLTRRQTVANGYQPGGVITIWFEGLYAAPPYAEHEGPPAGSELEMKRLVENVAEEVIDYLDQQGGPFVQSVQVTLGPGTNKPDEWPTKGCRLCCEVEIEWGREE